MLDLGELLMELGERGPAAEKFRHVLELSPEDATAMFYLGEVALLEGSGPEALDLFRRALRCDRTFPRAHLRIAQLYFQQNHRAEAAFHANCELSQQTNDEQTLVELGNLFLDLDQLGPAETTLMSKTSPSKPVTRRSDQVWTVQPLPSFPYTSCPMMIVSSLPVGGERTYWR